jgi:hypothetical protein
VTAAAAAAAATGFFSFRLAHSHEHCKPLMVLASQQQAVHIECHVYSILLVLAV